jgi:hypothetical protein
LSAFLTDYFETSKKRKRVEPFNMLMRHIKILLVILLFPVVAFAADAEITEQKNWSFNLEPYLMATNIVGNASVGRATGVDVDVEFSDILETLNIAAMIHFEGLHKSGWGIWLDYGFMDLSQDSSGPVGGVASTDLRQGVMEAFALYRQNLQHGYIDYIAGIRWWDNDIDATVDSTIIPGSKTIKVRADWIDTVIGARWTHHINENWQLRLRGDIGGFGLSSDFTGTASAGIIYVINDLMDIDLTYKATWVDYEEGTKRTPDYFEYDTITHGPILGLNFKF